MALLTELSAKFVSESAKVQEIGISRVDFIKNQHATPA